MEKPRIDLRDTPTIKCESCGGVYFREVTLLKKVSKLLTGSSEDTLVPFPIYQCVECKHVNDGFNPFAEETDKDNGFNFVDTTTTIKKQ